MKRWLTAGFVLLVVLGLSFSPVGSCIEYHTPKLRVFIKDEGFHEKNIVKPRIYLENLGRQTVHDLDLYYYFTVERGKTPVLEQYYLPNGQVSLIRESRRKYKVRYRFRNINLKPGQIFPDQSGCVIGIHYSDWSEFIKDNDYSDPGSPNWKPTRRVDIEVRETFNRNFDR